VAGPCHTDKELTELGECPYDEGGYFIINGSEKVLIAQEKMSTNHVYVFQKRQPSKYMWAGAYTVHFSAQRKRILLNKRYVQRLFRVYLGGV
jgi:DNA-directed RNA polymerase beta subunit